MTAEKGWSDIYTFIIFTSYSTCWCAAIFALTCNSWALCHSVCPAARWGGRGWRTTSPRCQRAACWSRAGCHCRTPSGIHQSHQGGTCWHAHRKSLLMTSSCSAGGARGPHSLNKGHKETSQCMSCFQCMCNQWAGFDAMTPLIMFACPGSVSLSSMWDSLFSRCVQAQWYVVCAP